MCCGEITTPASVRRDPRLDTGLLADDSLDALLVFDSRGATHGRDPVIGTAA